jgi:hypothetical protein
VKDEGAVDARRAHITTHPPVGKLHPAPFTAHRLARDSAEPCDTCGAENLQRWQLEHAGYREIWCAICLLLHGYVQVDGLEWNDPHARWQEPTE